MNDEVLTPSRAAINIVKWLRTYLGGSAPLITDLDLVRQMLPGSPYGKGVTAIKGPAAISWSGCEGALVRNPENPTEWGIFYHPDARAERQRFTVAHELGHFVLHRERTTDFQCASGSVYSGSDALALMEREANVFASHLLMPGDLFTQAIRDTTVDLRFLSELATRFAVSFEALCIRFIEYTELRAILICWDNGFLDYECRSATARRTRAKVKREGDPQEPPQGSLAAALEIQNEWRGVQLAASIWCPNEAQHMTLREFKHSYPGRDRVLTLLILESAEPRALDTTWHDETTQDSFERFAAGGQHPDR